MGRQPVLGKNALNKIENQMIWKILFELVHQNQCKIPRTKNSYQEVFSCSIYQSLNTFLLVFKISCWIVTRIERTHIRNKNPASQGHLQAPRCHTFAKDTRGYQGARGVLTARKTDAEHPKMVPGSPGGVLTPQNDSVASSTVSLHFRRPGRLTPLRQTPIVPDATDCMIALGV